MPARTSGFGGCFARCSRSTARTSWGAGDHSDLEALMDWTASLGGNMVATLPMLASNFDGPNPHISPYLADLAVVLERVLPRPPEASPSWPGATPRGVCSTPTEFQDRSGRPPRP